MYMKKLLLTATILSVTLYAGIIENIQKENKIRIGIKYDTKPFGFKEGKTIKGFDLELSKLIIEEIRKKQNLPELRYFYKKVIPADREENIITKKVDMVIATYTINEQRKEKIAFSKPYFKDGVVIIHRGAVGKTPVGVLTNSTIREEIVKKGYSVKEYLTYDALYHDFENAKIDAISSNTSIMNSYIKSDKYSAIEFSTVEEYGIGLPKDDPEFKKLIDEILDELKKNGEYDKLYVKWFK